MTSLINFLQKLNNAEVCPSRHKESVVLDFERDIRTNVSTRSGNSLHKLEETDTFFRDRRKSLIQFLYILVTSSAVSRLLVVVQGEEEDKLIVLFSPSKDRKDVVSSNPKLHLCLLFIVFIAVALYLLDPALVPER